MCSVGISHPVMEGLLKKTRCMYNHPVRYACTVNQPRGSVWASARLCHTCHMFFQFSASYHQLRCLTRTSLAMMDLMAIV